MRKLLTYLRWLFWCLWYLPQRKPKYFEAAMIRLIRTQVPWWKFKPHVSFNPDAPMIAVYLSEEVSYVGLETLTLEVHRGQESGRIVGFTIWEDQLRAKP